jgi:hypothetical protein
MVSAPCIRHSLHHLKQNRRGVREKLWNLHLLFAGLLARCHYNLPECTATCHLDPGFPLSPRQTTRCFRSLQFATACSSCTPSHLNSSKVTPSVLWNPSPNRSLQRNQQVTISRNYFKPLLSLFQRLAFLLLFPYSYEKDERTRHGNLLTKWRSIVGRDSSVGIVARYGLDGPGIESRWGRDFPHLSRPALGTTQPPIQWVPGLSRG